jgi:MerR family copper efflux transcriptional regulator
MMSNLKAGTPLKTGELARRAGVNVETLRFYERKGLLPEPPRRASGYREYNEADVRRVRFIRRAQGLGFTLAEVRNLLALRVERGTTADDVKHRAKRKIADVRRKIAELAAIERALVGLTASCNGKGPTGDCPILHHMEGDEWHARDRTPPRGRSSAPAPGGHH